MGLTNISTLRCPSLAPVKERVEIQDMHEHVITKDRTVVTGANEQAADALMTVEGKPTYAGVLKQSGSTRGSAGVVSSKSKFTD
jgi:hypothetical protein